MSAPRIGEWPMRQQRTADCGCRLLRTVDGLRPAHEVADASPGIPELEHRVFAGCKVRAAKWAQDFLAKAGEETR